MDNSLDYLTASENGDVLTLEINATMLNDFDLAHATATEIEKAISGWRTNKAILSLKNVEFVSSVGLIVFARLITFVKKSGAQIVLCESTPTITKLLNISRLATDQLGPNDQRLLLKDDQDAAVQALA